MLHVTLRRGQLWIDHYGLIGLRPRTAHMEALAGLIVNKQP